MDKILVSRFHCDNCGEDTDLVSKPLDVEKEYVCPHCSSKKFYTYDDYYVARTDKHVKY